MPSSSWASPIVATLRMMRGAFQNRRITRNSTAEPSAIATTIVIGSTTKYG